MMRSATSGATRSPPLAITARAWAPSIGSSRKRLRMTEGMRRRKPSTSARKSSRKLKHDLAAAAVEIDRVSPRGVSVECRRSARWHGPRPGPASSSMKARAAAREASSAWPSGEELFELVEHQHRQHGTVAGSRTRHRAVEVAPHRLVGTERWRPAGIGSAGGGQRAPDLRRGGDSLRHSRCAAARAGAGPRAGAGTGRRPAARTCQGPSGRTAPLAARGAPGAPARRPRGRDRGRSPVVLGEGGQSRPRVLGVQPRPLQP